MKKIRIEDKLYEVCTEESCKGKLVLVEVDDTNSSKNDTNLKKITEDLLHKLVQSGREVGFKLSDDITVGGTIEKISKKGNVFLKYKGNTIKLSMDIAVDGYIAFAKEEILAEKAPNNDQDTPALGDKIKSVLQRVLGEDVEVIQVSSKEEAEAIMAEARSQKEENPADAFASVVGDILQKLGSSETQPEKRSERTEPILEALLDLLKK